MKTQLKRVNGMSLNDTRIRAKEGKIYERHYYDIDDNDIIVSKGEDIQIVTKNDEDFFILNNVTHGTGSKIVIPYK